MPPELSPYAPTGFAAGRDPRSRIVAGAGSAVLVALMLWLMIEMGLVTLPAGPMLARLVAMDIRQPQQQESGGHSPKPQPQHQSARPATVTPQPNHPTTPHPVPNAQPAHSFIHLSQQEFASADIGKMSNPNSNQSGDGDNNSGASTYGPGEGPGGAHLFRAEWYREPRDAQIDPYIQRAAPSGSWAEIACRTAENHKVEDCQELDESPPGSGLARGLRNAAWQFLVRAPRLNGHEQMGVWVRIRFDFITRKARETDLPPDQQGTGQ